MKKSEILRNALSDQQRQLIKQRIGQAGWKIPAFYTRCCEVAKKERVEWVTLRMVNAYLCDINPASCPDSIRGVFAKTLGLSTADEATLLCRSNKQGSTGLSGSSKERAEYAIPITDRYVRSILSWFDIGGKTTEINIPYLAKAAQKVKFSENIHQVNYLVMRVGCVLLDQEGTDKSDPLVGLFARKGHEQNDKMRSVVLSTEIEACYEALKNSGMDVPFPFTAKFSHTGEFTFVNKPIHLIRRQLDRKNPELGHRHYCFSVYRAYRNGNRIPNPPVMIDYLTNDQFENFAKASDAFDYHVANDLIVDKYVLSKILGRRFGHPEIYSCP